MIFALESISKVSSATEIVTINASYQDINNMLEYPWQESLVIMATMH